MLNSIKSILSYDLFGSIKAMPEQPDSKYGQEHAALEQDTVNLYNAYTLFECVNRGVNLIADSIATIPIDVMDRQENYVPVSKRKYPTYRGNDLSTLLNIAPNPDQDRVEFFTGICIDLLLTGNAYLYFDGKHLYRLPVIYIKVKAGAVRLVEQYIYTPNGVDIIFDPDEVIRLKYGSATNPYIGSSRLSSAINSLGIIDKMNTYQKNYFKNSTILGVVLHSKNILGERTKRRLKTELQGYRPDLGANRPIILDGDVTLDNLSKQTNKDLDYDLSLKAREERVLHALGVPPTLLDPSNTNTVNENIKMFYLLTVIPLMQRIVSGLERYFGYDLKIATAEIPAMIPDERNKAQSLQTLVNSGILTRNEARNEIRYGEHSADFADDLIIPANIAGSALDSSVGGRPQNADK